MSINQVAFPYARALFEIAKSNNSTEKIFAELREVATALTKEISISQFLNSPVAAIDAKKAVLKKALEGKASAEVLSSILLMADKGRLAYFGDMVSAFELIIDESNGVSRGTVRSATPLDAEARKKIEDTVTKATKKKVILSFKEDSKIIGGMIAQVGGLTFDDSLDSHLIRMNEELKRRAN